MAGISVMGRMIHLKGEKRDFLPLMAGQIISLRDMNDFAAAKLVDITAAVEYLEKSAIYHSSERGRWTYTEVQQIKSALGKILPNLDFLSLGVTRAQCERIIADMNTLTAEDLKKRGVQLRHILNDELGSRVFLVIPFSKLKSYNNTEIAGPDFKRAFPRGNDELIEAGNCLVTDRHTACVFHLMRAFEIALVSLERTLGIMRPTLGPDKTWGKTLKRIRLKIEENDKGPPSNWITDREFYDKAHVFLAAVKTPLRDDTMHVETTYDEQGAQSVFNVSIEALRFLSTKLKE
jgi:hypothetical protein